MSKRTIIVVDGSNVAFQELTSEGKPKVGNLVAVRELLLDQGYDPIVVVDARLRHDVDDEQELEALIEKQLVRQAPAGTDADFFVLGIADDHGAQVVSNDRFDDFQERFPWIRERRRPLMIVRGKVRLYERSEAEEEGRGGGR